MQRILFAVATALTALALYVLHLRTLFGWSWFADGWLEEHRCAVGTLCTNDIVFHNHVGVLALVGAIAVFALAFRMGSDPATTTVVTVDDGEGDNPADTSALGDHTTDTNAAAPALTAQASRHRLGTWIDERLRGGIRPAFALGAAVLVWQVVATLQGNIPGRSLWALCLGAVLLGTLGIDRTAGRQGLGSGVAGFAAIAVIALGIGSVNASPWIAIVLAIAGSAVFGWALRSRPGTGGFINQRDMIAMGLLTIVALLLGLARAWSWRYAFVGDEWIFYETARGILADAPQFGTFEIGGPNDYFTGATFEAQAGVMRLAGANVYGWRLASLLPFVLSIPPMYVFVRWLSGRTAAIVAAITLAGAHVLLSFSMVAYNNTQALLAVSVSLAAFAVAERRRSAMAFALLGVALGSTFIVYAMARLVALPVGLLFVAVFRRDIVAGVRWLGWTTLGFVTTAAPVLFNIEGWSKLLKATPVQAEDPAAETGVLRQVTENIATGFLQFVGNVHNTHFIVGPHLDLISGALVIVGLGVAASTIGRRPLITAWLFGSVAMWAAVNGIQQYAQISNTRSFLLPLVYCVFAGLAAAAIVDRIPERLASHRLPAVGLAVVFAGLVVGINQLHISEVANDRQQLTAEAMLVGQFESTAAADGSGMAIHMLWPADWTVRESIVLSGYEIPPERGGFLTADELAGFDALCSETADASMVVVHHLHPERDAIREHMADCWPGVVPTTILDPHGDARLDRYLSPEGVVQSVIPQAARVSTATDHRGLDVADAIDVAVDGSGVSWVLSGGGGERNRLTGFAVDGRELGAFDLDQRHGFDVAITTDGFLVVAGAHSDDQLVWYNGAGQPVRRYAGGDRIGEPNGIATGPDGSLFVSDGSTNVVLHLDQNFEVLSVRSGRGQLDGPASLVEGAAGSVWVYNARAGEILLLTDDDNITVRVPVRAYEPLDAPRIGSAGDGGLLYPDPEGPQIHYVDADGSLARVWGQFRHPVAVAADHAGRIVVVDEIWPRVTVAGPDGLLSPPRTGIPDRAARATAVNLAMVEPEVALPTVDVDTVELEAQSYIALSASGVVRPVGIAVADIDGPMLVVADAAGTRLLLVRPDGGELASVGLGAGASSQLTDVAVGPDGDIYVLDGGAARLHRYTPAVAGAGAADDAEPVVGVGDTKPEAAPAADALLTRVWSVDAIELQFARGLDVTNDGEVLVAGTTQAAVLVFDDQGRLTDRTTVRDGDSQPVDVVAANDGSLWIVDAGAGDLLHMHESGTMLETLPLSGFNSVDAPHLALANDRLLVTRPEEAQVLDVSSNLATSVVRPSGAAATKTLGIAIGADDEVWVVDSDGGAVTSLVLD